jgi:hypothetical protein
VYLYSPLSPVITVKSHVSYLILGIQVIIWWAGLMRGAVSIALAYNKVKSCAKYISLICACFIALLKF